MMAVSAIKTVVVSYRYASSSIVFSILDILASVGRDWELLHGEPPQSEIFRTAFLSLDGQPYDDPNGRCVTPDGSLSNHQYPDLVIVPELHLDPSAPLPEDIKHVAAWIRAAHADGAIVTSVCSGALVLAEAGLLDGLDATTHWGYSSTLAQRYPNVRLRGGRILVPAGEGHRIVTAGGASSWGDLMLYLIGRLVGQDAARQIAKIYLLEPHNFSQLCYASLVVSRQHDDKLVLDAQTWIADNYAIAKPVSTMARRSGLSERNFLRRFRQVTGQSPTEYVQTLRVEEAKQMLETTTDPIDDIAAGVGYSEPSSFRSAFKKLVGISASAYRKKWVGTFRV